MNIKQSEMDKLKARIDAGLHWSVTKGPEWNNLSREERAKFINDVLDAVENGDTLVIPDGHLDGPPWFPLPQISMDDLMANGFKYKKWQVLTYLHKLAYRFNMWYLWRKHYNKKWMQNGKTNKNQ